MENKSFFNENKKHWSEIKDLEGKVLVEGRAAFFQLFGSGLVARAIYENENITPIVLSHEITKELRAGYSSFGINNFLEIGTNKIIKKNLRLAFKSTMTSLIGFLTILIIPKGFERFTTKYKIRNVLIGDLIYDTYIRYDKNFLDPRLGKVKLLKIIFRSVFKFYYTYDVFDKNKVNRVVVTTWDYADTAAYIARIADHENIPIVLSSRSFLRQFDCRGAPYSYPTRVIYSESYLLKQGDITKLAEDYCRERFGGGEIDSSFGAFQKKKWTKNELYKCFDIESELSTKAIFVMPHCFSDANHGGGWLIFKDYFSWFIETLKEIRKNKNVFWFVKEHPAFEMYDEGGIVRLFVEKYKSENVFLLPSDFSTASVFNIADTIVTTRGTVALEAPCHGVPAIVCGNTPFSGFGIVEEPNTKEEYFLLISKIQDLEKIHKEKRNEAKKILYLYHFDFRLESSLFSKISVLPNHTKEERFELYKEIALESIEILRKTNPRKDIFFKTVSSFCDSGEGGGMRKVTS